ncbi:MAG: CDP-diacylglycerol--serine O-phosphatidyltransferase, partial [Blastocatellia bacterium]
GPANRTLDQAQDEAQARRLRQRFRKGVFVIPSLLTTANIFCGFYSVMESLAGAKMLALLPPEGLEFVYSGAVSAAAEHFDRAAITIGLAALFDLLDGRVARMTNATSEFGLELDSIADVVSFGIAPAMLAFAWGYGEVPSLHNVGWAASFLFVICGALRLARFNVQARRPHSNLPPKNPKVDKKAFVGMPIPVGATMIASIAHFSPTPMAYVVERRLWSLVVGPHVYSTALIVLVVCLAFLMISTIRYSSFKNASVGNRNPRILIIGLALVVTLIWFYSQWVLLIISTLYVSYGIVAKLWSLLKPRHAPERPPERPDVELDSKPSSDIRA